MAVANGLIEATDNGSSPTYQHSDDFAGVYFYNCEHCAFRNLTVSNLFVKNTSDSQGGGTGIGVGYGSNNSFYNNTIHDTASGISNAYEPNGTTSNIEVYNNTIYHCNWGFSSGDRGDNAIFTGLSIHDNDIYDAYMWDDLINNSFHHNGIHIWVTSASSQISGPLIYNNYIHGDFGARETGHIFLDVDGGPIVGPKVFNNLLVVGSTVNTPTNGLITAGTRLGNVPLNQEIYNNTLIGAGGGSAMIVAPGATVKNNVIANVAQFIRIEVGSLAAADNNVYQQNTPSGCDPFAFDGVCSGGGARNFSAWQTACNCDAHGVFSSSISVNSDGTLQSGVAGNRRGIQFDRSWHCSAGSGYKAGAARPGSGRLGFGRVSVRWRWRRKPASADSLRSERHAHPRDGWPNGLIQCRGHRSKWRCARLCVDLWRWIVRRRHARRRTPMQRLVCSLPASLFPTGTVDLPAAAWQSQSIILLLRSTLS